MFTVSIEAHSFGSDTIQMLITVDRAGLKKYYLPVLRDDNGLPMQAIVVSHDPFRAVLLGSLLTAFT